MNCISSLKYVPLPTVVVLGSLLVILTWRYNYGIFYHCLFLAFWPVFGRRARFHSFPVHRVSSDRWQAFFPFLAPCYAILSSQALGSAWGFSAMPFSPLQRPYTGFSCPPLYPIIVTHKRPLCAILQLYKGNQF